MIKVSASKSAVRCSQSMDRGLISSRSPLPSSACSLESSHGMRVCECVCLCVVGWMGGVVRGSCGEPPLRAGASAATCRRAAPCVAISMQRSRVHVGQGWGHGCAAVPAPCMGGACGPPRHHNTASALRSACSVPCWGGAAHLIRVVEQAHTQFICILLLVSL